MGAYLVRSLIQVLGVKRTSETKRHTRTKQDVVGESGNTTVVDLGLTERTMSLS